MANSTFGSSGQALLQTASSAALQMIITTSVTTTTSATQMSEVIGEGEVAECVSMNDLLWDYRQDLTTRPLIMGLFALCYTIIIFLGVIGNICVILAISRTRSLQTVPNMFIFSLSCSDVVVCCTSATITPITAFQKEWLFGRFLCSVAPFIAGVSLCFSTFTLAAISLDRFMLIRFPMKKPFSHVQAFFVICLICVLAMAMSVPVMFMQTLKPLDRYCGQFCYEDWGANANQRRAYGTLMLTLQFIIPLVVIVFCYTAISLRLGQSVILKSKKKQGGYEWQLQMSDQQRAATKRRQRTNRMFIAMVVAFSLSWIWTLMFNLLRDYEILPQFVKDQEFFFGILTHCIAMTSTVWNPFVYAFLNLQLRAAFWQLMPMCLKQCLENHLAGKKTAKKNSGPAQEMHMNGHAGNKQDSKRRRSSPINPARRASQKAANANGRLLLSTGNRDYEDETTATIAGFVEGDSPILTATSALMESTLMQNGANAKYGSFDVAAPVFRPVSIPGYAIGLVREDEEGLMKSHSLHTSTTTQSAISNARAGKVSPSQSTQTVFHNHIEPDPNVPAQQPLSGQWPTSGSGPTAYCDPLFTSNTAIPQKIFVKELVNSWSAACDQRERRLSGQLSQPLGQTLSKASAEHRRGVWTSRALTLNPHQPAVGRPTSARTIQRAHRRNSTATHSTLQQQHGQSVRQSGRLHRRKSHRESNAKCLFQNGVDQQEVFNSKFASNCETGGSNAHTGPAHCAFCHDHTPSQCWIIGCECRTCCSNGLKVEDQGWSVPNSPRYLRNMTINKSSDSVSFLWNEEKGSSTRGKLQECLLRQLSNSTNS